MEYIDAFYNALLNILPFTSQGQQAFFFMLVGIFIGFWVGILPGLGGAATLALMLPIHLQDGPHIGLCLSLGVERRNRYDRRYYFDPIRRPR